MLVQKRCLDLYTYVSIHTFIHTYIYIHSFIYIYIYIYIHTHTYIHTYIQVVKTARCIYGMLEQKRCLDLYTYVSFHPSIHPYIHSYIYIYIYTYIHIYIHKGGENGEVYIWDVGTEKMLRFFKGHEDTITALDYGRCVCIYVYMYVCMCVCIYIYIYICVCVCKDMRTRSLRWIMEDVYVCM